MHYHDEEDEELDADQIADMLYQSTDDLDQVPNAAPDETGLIKCLGVPLREMVVYPRMVTPIFFGDESTRLAVETAHLEEQTAIALVPKDPEMENPGPKDFLPVGVELAVGRVLRMPDGTHSALVQGRQRVSLEGFTRRGHVWRVQARPIYENEAVDRNTKATMRAVLELFDHCVKLNRDIPGEAYLFAINIEEPGWLADMVTSTLRLPLETRHELLLLLDPLERLQRLMNLLAQEADVLELEDEIQTRTQSEMDRSQREYYLREQMRVIQTELGEDDPWTQDLLELRKKIEEASLPEEVETAALKEISRLHQMPPMSPEMGMIRTYLDWIIDLPWNAMTDDNLDVTHAEEMLERFHYGLPKAKERILEFIAVRSLKPKRTRHPILCFVGPPGTGKTSLGRSIAEALGRKFVHVSLGGVRDEAEIRGHRRTYIGALPGRILHTIHRAGIKNPLFMLDEIDKLGYDYRGDPAAALLEVLDPEQNYAFSDHYLELPFDLSQVMFITTANIQDTIPFALLDRMEIIEFPGYIEEEKLEIARHFLVPRQLEESGLEEQEIHFSDQAIKRVIREFTYEAGVRNLEREIGRISRKIARLKAAGKSYSTQIVASAIGRYLGPTQFFNLEAERQDEIGIATALAWTHNGGEIMPVEVLLTQGKGGMQITGQVGDVMQESAHAALSYLKSRSKVLNVNPCVFEETDVHIHVPEGAIPKDGPSAGITIATALISAFTQRKFHKEVGMTGEITLRGNVLPVGGVREKILAAHRAGLKTVIIPKRNAKDLVEVTKKARNYLQIMLVEHMDEVLDVALFPPEEKPASKHKKVDEEKEQKT